MGSMFEKFKQNENQELKEYLPNPVYYIESSNDDTVLVGLDVSVEHNDDNTSTITWYDTSHERKMIADEVRQGEDYFAFKRIDAEGGAMYRMTRMDLNTYREKVKNHLIAGEDFDNENDMIDAFLKTYE